MALPYGIFPNEHEQLMEIYDRVTNLSTLIEFQDFFKYFATRTQRISIAIDNLYEKIFADPGYLPKLATSTKFVQLLNEIKHKSYDAIEFNSIANVERKHFCRFWTSRQNGINSGGHTGNSYFFRIQVDRVKGLMSAFEIVYDSIPLIKFPQNVSIYCPKQELFNIGNFIEVGEESEQLSNSFQPFSMGQHLNCIDIPNALRPWNISVNEANVEAYAEILSFIISKANLGECFRSFKTAHFFLLF